MDKKRVYSELSLLGITVIWGLGFPITNLAFSFGYDAYTIMVGRFLIAGIILTLVFIKKFTFVDKKIILYGSITGIFLFLGFLFQTMGNELTTPSKNGFITQLNIVLVPYLYYVFFKKRVDVYNVISVIVAIFGLYLLSFGFSVDFVQSFNLGDFYTFICAIMVAFNVVTGSYFQRKYDFDPALFVLFNIYISMILSVGAMMVFTSKIPFAWNTVWPLIFLGVFNTALGFLVQSYALKYSLPTRVSLIVALEAVFGAIGSVLIVFEVLTMEIVIGGLLITSGVLITEMKPFKKMTKVIE